jgi:C4-dicarboxylate-specific signal transduction histidine kinase/sugar lactone lactonase YvrE
MSGVTSPTPRLHLALAAAAAVAVAVALATFPARAQRVAPADTAPPADLAVSQYQHDRWTTADGLPNHAVDWVVRSPDGYLWLGTEGGLVRFDGVRFTLFDRSNTPALQGSDAFPTVPLHVDRRGVLWIATTGGLVRYADGAFERAAAAGQPDAPAFSRMVEDRAGRLWAWVQDIDSRLYEVRDGRLVPPDPQAGLRASVNAVAEDPDGDLWVATVDRALLRVHDGRAVSVRPAGAMPDGVTKLHVARDGVVWVGTQRGFGRLQHGRFEFRRLGAGGLSGYVSAFAEDAAGDVWMGTVGMGLLRWHAGRLERFDRRDGLSRDAVTSLLVDREGSLWVGTRGGLDRLRRGAIATFTPRNGGPPFADPGALLLDRRGHFVVGGATAGLVAGRPGTWAPLPGAAAASSRKVWTLAQGRDGVWVGGDGTLTLYRAPGTAAALRVYTARDGLAGKWVLSVAEDSLRRVWVGTDRALFRLEQGRFRAFTTAHWLPHGNVRVLVVDGRGAVWVGTNDGVARVVGDSVRSWGPAHGLAGPSVLAIRELRDGTIWLGTSGGLTRVRDGRLVPIRAEQGLPGELVTAIEEAGDDLWIVTGRGISRVPLAELDAVADGRARRVHATTFGTRDGLPATEVVAPAQPLSARSPDGRLWFSTAGGLAVVDPRRIPRNAVAPAVHIEEVSADGVRLTTRARGAPPVRVPARTRRLTLRYTATSLLLPDRVRFRYRLVGYDRAWADAASAERVVSYTNLGPGPYTFRIIAANDAGVWNTTGASLELTVSPAFYQTIWFGALCAAVLAASLAALHRARVRQLERRAEERKRADEALATLRVELAHATRVTSLATLTASIAHEVNQPLSGIVTNAGTCQRMLAGDPPNVDGAREAVRRLVRDGNRAADVVARVRALFARKPPAAEPVDLNEATREVLALSRGELERGRAAVRLELAEDLPLVMGDRVQLQQVVSNLLRNACEAMYGVDDRARELVVTTARDDGDRVCLRVRDSGVGFGTEGAEKLFEAFHTTKRDGMGIGLSVSRSIIERHHGRLWAEPNDGPGATFAFSIPRRQETGEDVASLTHQPVESP